MHGPPRTYLDVALFNQVTEIFGNLRDQQYASAQLATMLLSLKPGQRICVERSDGNPDVFKIITQGKVDLNVGGS